jgi:hypothetical protein
MVKFMTLHKVLKKAVAFRETHLNTTLQVVHRARENVTLNILILQSYTYTYYYPSKLPGCTVYSCTPFVHAVPKN